MNPRFSTNDVIPTDGWYYVFHEAHRIVRTVMLSAEDRFPRCSQCADLVIFELIVPVSREHEDEPVHVFELPLDPEELSLPTEENG